MNHFARACCVLILLMQAPLARAAGLFEQPVTSAQLLAILGPAATELQAAQTLRGRYSQRKQLAELPKPLLAEGDFLFVRGRGINWRTLKPFASMLTITAEELIQSEGGRERRLDAARQPALRLVGELFFAVLSLDLKALEPRFKFHGERGADGGWRLGLLPRQPSGRLQDIEVSGHQSVERVLLREQGGDLTDIRLHDSVASGTPPSAADLAQFPQ